MHWFFAIAALAAFVLLAFRQARSRRVLFATLAVLGLICGGAALFLALDAHLIKKRERVIQGITADQIAISDTKLVKEFGRWMLTGTLTNNAPRRITSLTLHVTVQDCADASNCKTVGETDATSSSLDIEPETSGVFSMLLYLPDLEQPKAMKWDYEVKEIGSRGQ